MEKMLAKGQAPQLVREDEQEPASRPCGPQDEDSSEPDPGFKGEAPGSNAHCGGPAPEKNTKGPSRDSPMAKARANKKQQVLAAAALKDSQNITRFFCQRAESPPPPASAPRAEGPSCEGVRGPLAATPEKCTEEDGALGHLAAHPQPECPREWTR